MSDQDPNARLRPDLDEDTNVGETHAVFEGATAATIRERRLHENGMEPVPLWLFLFAGLALLVGGVVLASGGRLFDYGQDSMWANEWIPAAAKDDGPPTEGEILPFFISQGAKTYGKCAGCHGADGAGDGANYPPLAGSEWVTGENTEALGLIILNGLTGPIEVAGKTWNSVMPAQGPLSAKELATLMTYLRSGLNEVGDIVSVVQAEELIALYEERGAGSPVTASELQSSHMKMVAGDSVDPTTVIDFETYEPVGSAGGN
ncbi:c-type cytochrome [Roseibacillus ishigakijimensis]|uniref:Cytochrome c n=1 Tax=Roseibacillus ishigakijimensis TaxID=454146 RepID=A0A934VNA2_9BACT|nr:cytochrome c [Roseibacillus ishigakijimensis]MBK1834901.1 cytochrome c [Roseibacillus ishigakijimensis]